AIVVAALLAFAMRCELGVNCVPPISLSATSNHVTYFPHKGSQTIVTLGKRLSVESGDAIDVDARGEALLHFPDFQDVRMFRDSKLNIVVTSTVSADTPAIYRLQLEAGTLYHSGSQPSAPSQRLLITTKWAEIQHIGTDFLAYYDPRTERTWVVVVSGAVEVRAPSVGGPASLVTVPAGWQTWVDPGKAPEPPHPATRAEVGTLFPVVEALTNSALADPAVLAPAL